MMSVAPPRASGFAPRPQMSRRASRAETTASSNLGQSFNARLTRVSGARSAACHLIAATSAVVAVDLACSAKYARSADVVGAVFLQPGLVTGGPDEASRSPTTLFADRSTSRKLVVAPLTAAGATRDRVSQHVRTATRFVAKGTPMSSRGWPISRRGQMTSSTG